MKESIKKLPRSLIVTMIAAKNANKSFQDELNDWKKGQKEENESSSLKTETFAQLLSGLTTNCNADNLLDDLQIGGSVEVLQKNLIECDFPEDFVVELKEATT